ncbi:hypothetical protein GGG16DRAFT_119537 [Schizophyllum commune]
MRDLNYVDYDFDLTDLVSRAEQTGQTPLHLVMSDGVPITTMDHAPVVIHTLAEVQRPQQWSRPYVEQQQFEPTNTTTERPQPTEPSQKEEGRAPTPSEASRRSASRTREVDTSHIQLGHIPTRDGRQSTRWTTEHIQQEIRREEPAPPMPTNASEVTDLDYASDHPQPTRLASRASSATTLIATSPNSSRARHLQTAQEIELTRLDTPPEVARLQAEIREREIQLQAELDRSLGEGARRAREARYQETWNPAPPTTTRAPLRASVSFHDPARRREEERPEIQTTATPREGAVTEETDNLRLPPLDDFPTSTTRVEDPRLPFLRDPR